MAMSKEQAQARAARAFATYRSVEIRARARRREELSKCAEVLTLEQIGNEAKPPVSKGRISQILSEEPL